MSAGPLTFPHTFNKSFWTPEYRRGVTQLYAKLNAGLKETSELVTLIRRRQNAHYALSTALFTSADEPLAAAGFGYDDGASLRRAFEHLKDEDGEWARVELAVSKKLENLADGLDAWRSRHADTLKADRELIMDALAYFEKCQSDSNKAKTARDAKATALEDIHDPTTLSPPSQLRPLSNAPQSNISSLARAFTSRVKSSTYRLRSEAFERDSAASDYTLSPTESSSSAVEREPDFIDIADIVKTPREWSLVFERARDSAVKTSVKVPLLGTFDNVYTGDELVTYFRASLDDLHTLQHTQEFVRQLVEELSILQLKGELGQKFFDSSDAFYQFRKEAFALPSLYSSNPAESAESQLTSLPVPKLRERRSSPNLRGGSSPNLGHASKPSLSSFRGPTPSSYIVSAAVVGSKIKSINSYGAMLQGVVGKAAASLPSNQLPKNRLEKATKDAEDAETTYKTSVEKVEEARLELEELIHEKLTRAQRMEYERIKACKSAITSYNGIIAGMVAPLQLSSERSVLTVDAILPEQDVSSIIERYRSGPFRPKPALWTDFYHEKLENQFGIDLRMWVELKKDASMEIPPAFEMLLDVLKAAYVLYPKSADKRKTWIYEVPLHLVHRLRNTLDRPDDKMPGAESIAQIDPPIIASTVKLWLLELPSSLVLPNLYEDIRKLYSSAVDGPAKLEQLKTEVLFKLPKINLLVLDALLSHLERLVDGTTPAEDEEKDDLYLTKLAFALSGCILRPKQETAITINDRFPVTFFIDLFSHRSELLVAAIAHKSRQEDERYVPKRKRTRPIDVRPTRRTMKVNQEDENPPVPALPSPRVEQEEKQLPVPEETVKNEENKTNVMEEEKGKPGLAISTTLSAVSSQDSFMTASPTVDPSSALSPEALDTSPVAKDKKNEELPTRGSSLSRPSSAASNTPQPSLVATDENDEDKPLTSSPSRGLQRHSADLSRRSAKLGRGPRPISVHGSPTTPMPESASSVKSRAALFESEEEYKPKSSQEHTINAGAFSKGRVS